MLILALIVIVALAAATDRWRRVRQLSSIEENVLAIWQVLLDSPLLGPDTWGQVCVFNQIMQASLDDVAEHGLWPDLRQRAGQLSVAISLAPEPPEAFVSPMHVQRLRSSAERLYALSA